MELIAGGSRFGGQDERKERGLEQGGHRRTRSSCGTRRQSRLSQALASIPAISAAQINLGNLLFLQQDYDEALTAYQDARQDAGRKRGRGKNPLRLLINISRTYYQMEKYDEAKEYYGKARRWMRRRPRNSPTWRKRRQAGRGPPRRATRAKKFCSSRNSG